ncbi:MAG: glycosyltransferase involved in cell wall biosynthesis [Polaribacter sp.]|jgi:glycosyltransferase involved in cell wall biosynthesis
MKCNILIFMQNLAGGGAERVVLNIIKKLDKNRFNICLVLVAKTGELLDQLPDHIELINLNKRSTSSAVFSLRKAINEFNPDLVFSSLARTHIVLYLALKLAGVKSHLILRSPNSPKQYMKSKPIGMISRYLLGKAYRSCELLVAQTESMKCELITYHGVKKENIKVFLNPVDFNNIDLLIENVDNPFDNNYTNIVAAGRIIEQKGFDILIKSFATVVKANPNFRLHIIGEDVVGEKAKLEKLAHTLNITDYISFLGFQSNPYKFYVNADLYVLSSRWEGMPNTVLENLYLEKCIVATKCIPFLSDIIEDGKNGVLVDVEDTQALAEAILAYEKLSPVKFKIFDKIGGDVNDLFDIEKIHLEGS